MYFKKIDWAVIRVPLKTTLEGWKLVVEWLQYVEHEHQINRNEAPESYDALQHEALREVIVRILRKIQSVNISLHKTLKKIGQKKGYTIKFTPVQIRALEWRFSLDKHLLTENLIDNERELQVIMAYALPLLEQIHKNKLEQQE